jgi:hypothetical protein
MISGPEYPRDAKLDSITVLPLGFVPAMGATKTKNKAAAVS